MTLGRSKVGSISIFVDRSYNVLFPAAAADRLEIVYQEKGRWNLLWMTRKRALPRFPRRRAAKTVSRPLCQHAEHAGASVTQDWLSPIHSRVPHAIGHNDRCGIVNCIQPRPGSLWRQLLPVHHFRSEGCGGAKRFAEPMRRVHSSVAPRTVPTNPGRYLEGSDRYMQIGRSFVPAPLSVRGYLGRPWRDMAI